MSLERFQALQARLVVDPGFRERVVAAQGALTEEPDLTALERRRLAAIARSEGLRISVLVHRGWRLGKLLTLLPRTCSMLGPDRAAAELDVFWRRQLPRSLYFHDEAIAFADHLADTSDDLGLPYLREVVAFERAEVELMRPGTEPGERRSVVMPRELGARLAGAIGDAASGGPMEAAVFVGERLAEGGTRWSLGGGEPAQH